MKFAFGIACAVGLGMTASCGGQEGSGELQKEVVAGEELSSSCAGIMPAAAPASWSHLYLFGSEGGCGVNTSDASGNVMLERTRGPGLSQEWETDLFEVFTSAGHARGGVVQNNSTRIFPQHWGFLTLGSQNGCGFNPDCKPDFGLRAWTADGALIRSSVPSFPVSDSQLDPAGGVVLAGVQQTNKFEIVVQRFDGHASAASAPAVVATGGTQPNLVLVSVSVSGLTLVLWNGDFSGFPANTIAGRWLDRFGHAKTGAFVVARNVTFNFLPGEVPITPLVDGSMAIRAHPFDPSTFQPEAWVALVRGGSTAVSAVPNWLATRPDARVYIVRGGRAYALIFPNDISTCGPAHLALFATAGNRCGGFDLDSGAPGSTCALESNIGRDGTLIVQGRTAPAEPSCKDRVFPALLR